MRKRFCRILLLAAAVFLFTGSAASAQEQTAGLRLLAVNVGKADSLLLFSGEDVYLIDTGTKETWPILSRALQVNGITHLDGVIITHADKDHVGGAWALAQSSLTIDCWYASAFSAKYTHADHPAALAAALRGQTVTWLTAGDSLPLSGGSLTVLGPTAANDEENNDSLVLLAEGGGGTMLLAGDMEAEEEALLISAGVIPRVDVLKVAHHGNKDTTSGEFVSLVSPKVAVISTSSQEEESTPAKSVLKALDAVNARVLVTEDAPQGILVTLHEGTVETALLDWPVLPSVPSGLALTAKDTKNERVTIKNTGSVPVDLSGYFIMSSRGSETFVFADGTQLQPGAQLTVATLSSKNAGDLLWPEESVWSTKNPDAAQLYDPWGQLVFSLD